VSDLSIMLMRNRAKPDPRSCPGQSWPSFVKAAAERPPVVEFHLVQPLLTARWGRA
jgi:hypothetical protein